MSKIVFGEVDWNSGDTGAPKNDYMRLEEGENVVRIMGNPTQFYIHWLTTSDGSKKKVVSPIDSMSLVSRLEDAGFRRQTRWIVKVLDRGDDSFKVLEVGSQIYNGIRALFNNPKWGKVTDYDLSIVRGPKGSQPLYSVQPNPKEKIDPALKGKFVEFNSRVDISKMTKPAEAATVCELLGWDASQFTQGKSDDGFTDEDFDFDDF
tara:strand:+ start:1346 stop:1963 length:618 start_codon:yes stop_codon:yes gene_type:complete